MFEVSTYLICYINLSGIHQALLITKHFLYLGRVSKFVRFFFFLSIFSIRHLGRRVAEPLQMMGILWVDRPKELPLDLLLEEVGRI